MSYISQDYKCPDCGVRYEAVLRPRDENTSEYPCGECGGTCHVAPFVNITRASWPDGVRKHATADLKERQALRKAERRARRLGDKDGVSKIKYEKTKLSKG